MMRGSKLLVMSQERDLRVIVHTFLGMLDIMDILAKRPTKYIPGRSQDRKNQAASALSQIYILTPKCICVQYVMSR